MQQLDLFGNPIETKPPQKKKVEEKTISIEPKQEPEVIQQTEPTSAIDEPEVSVEKNDSNSIQITKSEEILETPISNQQEEVEAVLQLHEPNVEIKEEPFVEIKETINIERVVFKKEKKAFKVPTAISAEKIPKQKKEKEIKLPQKRGRKSLEEINAEVDLIEIPDDDVLFQKQYYPISTVAEWFRVNTSLIRFWENEFDVLKPRKNRKGDRLFRPEDVKNLQLIYHLLREKKYTVEGAKDYLKSHKKKADTQLQITQSLQKIKTFLLNLKANLHS